MRMKIYEENFCCIFVAFLLLVLVGMPKNEVFADNLKQEVDNEKVFENDVEQEEIDRRIGIVFDYLNEHANSDFNGQDSLVFDIPVGEGVIVNVEVSNQEFLKTRVIGRSTYSIKANTTYNYKLTLSNVVGSGDVTIYNVNYTTGSPVAPGKTVYGITVSKVSITGTAPSGFSLGNKYTYIGSSNGNIIVSTGGYITYKRVLLSNKTISFNDVSLGSLPGGILAVDYSYGVN